MAASVLIFSIFSNSNENSGRSLFINYINPIEFRGPKPNNKVIKSITSSLIKHCVRTIKNIFQRKFIEEKMSLEIPNGM